MSRASKPLNPYASWSSLFGATVRRLRLGMRAGPPLTQGELGKQIGYSDAAVGAVERSALRTYVAFMEGCERVLPADGMLRAMVPFVLAEWQVWERTGQRPLIEPLPPAEVLADPVHLTGRQDLVVVQEPDVTDVLELARQAEASDLGGGTLEMVDRAVDRFCREYPKAAPGVLVPRVQQRLRYLARLLEGRVTLAQHRHLLVASGWLATLLACLQFDLGDRDGAEASQAAAYTFARQAEHAELLAWTSGTCRWPRCSGRWPPCSRPSWPTRGSASGSGSCYWPCTGSSSGSAAPNGKRVSPLRASPPAARYRTAASCACCCSRPAHQTRISASCRSSSSIRRCGSCRDSPRWCSSMRPLLPCSSLILYTADRTRSWGHPSPTAHIRSTPSGAGTPGPGRRAGDRRGRAGRRVGRLLPRRPLPGAG